MWSYGRFHSGPCRVADAAAHRYTPLAKGWDDVIRQHDWHICKTAHLSTVISVRTTGLYGWHSGICLHSHCWSGTLVEQIVRRLRELCSWPQFTRPHSTFTSDRLHQTKDHRLLTSTWGVAAPQTSATRALTSTCVMSNYRVRGLERGEGGVTRWALKWTHTINSMPTK